MLTSQNDISITSFYEAFMKTLYWQISELEEDFFTLSEGSNDEMRECTEKPKRSVNRKNFVIRCLEVLTFCVLDA